MNKISKILLLVLLVVSLVLPSAAEAKGRRKNRGCCGTTITVAAPDCYHGCVIPCGTCENVLHYHKVLVEHSCSPKVKTQVIKCCKPAPCSCNRCCPVVHKCCPTVVKGCKTVVTCKPVVSCRPVIVYQAAVRPVCVSHCAVHSCHRQVVPCCPSRVNCALAAPVAIPCGKKGDSN